jgi:zinc transport system ATP-binding protein
MTLALQVVDVSFRYYTHAWILQNVSWQVEKGAFVAIVGPNGGGKTTLLKLIMGSHAPTQGSIHVLGQSSTSQLTGVSYVPQGLRFDRQFPITTLEVVMMGRLSHLPWHGRYRAVDYKQAYAALEQVKLSHCAEWPFGDLSGGQRQRVLIARALASQPKLLLLDEPTASVDAQAEADIYHLLSDLKGKITIIMVTHDLQAALKTVDQVVCVQRSLRVLAADEICQHYALGLYHPPLTASVLPDVVS